ncbi:Anti-sigma regulatory factor (Ser/Thr protein kinase) [Streptomyces zhaozhouensis]|uniref:Anti-sigma regulatory factor (Ser/Thr protein kinase) n=1 Tax=Streptomyces zhaozhouensis TaxID=1300267 RepID=A0A286DSV3_9ACTN|nr:ATP-binding protein [Streptomyces zhaozhouensis]SOD61756.1 Anti-sigma regulatory factor (Ser/Thr protein kinase) [Streptomyces zhaozhouensis]
MPPAHGATPSPLGEPAIRPPQPPGESFALPARDTSVAVARRRVRHQLYGWGLPSTTCDNALLIVSELVTNAILHTQSSQVRCLLWSSGQLLRIEVADEGPGLFRVRPRAADSEAENGRGLLLLDALALRWGVVAPDQRAGCTVWAELTAAAQQSAPAAPAPHTRARTAQALLPG